MTARAGTEVEAANLALSRLGQPDITSFDDNTARARAVRANFASVRDAVLQRGNWGFATGYATPAEAAPPLAGWGGGFARRFPLPPDCVKVRSVDDSEANSWEVLSAVADPAGSIAEVKVLATDIAAPTIRYTRLIDNPRLWSPQFLQAFAHELAATIAPRVVGSTAKADSEAQKAALAISDAALEDGKEKARRTISRNTSWLRSRAPGGFGRGRYD